MQNTKLNNKLNVKKYDEDSTWDSFMEIIASGIRVSIFGVAVYVIKEICVLINDFFCCFQNYATDVINEELIPAGILLILSFIAYKIAAKD